MRRMLLGWMAFLALAVPAYAESVNFPPSPRRMLLVPIDDRPATGQFAQMIADIADVEIEMPPAHLLGQFLSPGDADGVLDWLASRDLGQYRAVIVSTDMIAYGGLIASRAPSVPVELAKERLDRLASIRRRTPGVPVFGFSSIMRLMPTSTTENRDWRELLRRAVINRDRFLRTANWSQLFEFQRIAAMLPPGVMEDYDEARARNHEVQSELLRHTEEGAFDYLIMGQDDAQPEGPQIEEGRSLRTTARELGVTQQVYFCEGIDQHANVLVSRALLNELDYQPRIRIVYADPLGTTVTPPYETQPLARSVADQIIASGARITQNVDDADYTLYINTPSPRPAQFQNFVESLRNEIDMGFPIAVADVNLGKSGTGDPNLFQVLVEGDRAMRLLAYAGWNTAGNTIGTTIPAANVYLAARKMPVDALNRELSQRAFLLHRLVNDFEYHRFTRPMAYAYIDRNPPAAREETYGERLQAVNRLVREDLHRRLDETFRTQFQGRRFFAGTRQFEVQGISQVNIDLPWPRAYEVRLNFRIQAREVGR